MEYEILGLRQSVTKSTGMLIVLRCILVPDMEILTWIGGEVLRGQFVTFELNLTLSV